MAQEGAGVVCPRKAPQSSPWIYFCCSVAVISNSLWPQRPRRPGFSDLHCLLEFAHIHIYSVGNAIQPSHSLLPYSLFAFNLSQHQGLFQRVNSSHQMANVFELQLQHQSFQWLFGIDFLHDWLVWSLCTKTGFQESSPAQFKRINSSALTLEPKEIKSITTSNFSPSICYEVMGLNAMILVFWMLSFKPAFSLSSFTLMKMLFSSSSLSAITVVSSAYQRLLIFLPAVFIPAYDSSNPTFRKMYSTYKLNKQGDIIQLCHTTFSIMNQSFVSCLRF